MMRTLVAVATCLSVALPAYAQTPSATGGPSGGPNQAQAVVPSGATGGRSGGPNQAQHVKKAHKSHSKKKKHH